MYQVLSSATKHLMRSSVEESFALAHTFMAGVVVASGTLVLEDGLPVGHIYAADRRQRLHWSKVKL